MPVNFVETMTKLEFGLGWNYNEYLFYLHVLMSL